MRYITLMESPVGTLPYGQTRSYAAVASAISNPTAVRAVRTVNGKNPISIIRRCHRVIGSDGHLVVYASGRAAKQYLLALDGAHRSPALT